MVPRVGVEPTRPYGQRILSPLEAALPSLTKRYEPVFTRLAVVKVSLRLVTYQHVPPPSWPHLQQICARAQNYETDYLSFGLKSRLSLRHTRQIVQAATLHGVNSLPCNTRHL